MRSTILLSSLIGAALVSAAPKAKSSSSCLCTETATITSTIVDKTIHVKSITTIPTTLAGNTKTIRSTTTLENDYTTTVTRPTTILVTASADASPAPAILARDIFLGKQKDKCSCASTTTLTKTKVAHVKTTATSVLTKVEKVAGPQVTISSVQTKSVSSVVETDTVYSSIYRTIHPTTSAVVVASRPAAGSSSSSLPDFTSSDIPSFTSSSVPSFTSSTATTPVPSGTGSFGDCSTIPSSFFVKVQGGSNDGFLSVSEYGFGTVQSADYASALLLNSTTSALVLPNDEEYYYDQDETVTLYSCSNGDGGYDQEMLSFTESDDGSDCVNGLMAFSLAPDCTFTVSDDNGALAPYLTDDLELWMASDNEDYYDAASDRSPATLVAVPAS